MAHTSDTTDLDLGGLTFTERPLRSASGGTWVMGRVGGHRIEALVYPEHAENPDHELGTSRVSKLWVQRLPDRRVVFNWDRGADVPAADVTVQQIVDVLAAGLAERVFGG